MVIKYVLILFVILTIILSGLFSGAETGIYRLSRLRLRLGIEKKRLSFILLGKAMHDRTRLLLSILVGNNLTHYIITSIITYLLWKGLTNNVEAAYTVELIATLITAPILLIFAELIPKNIFFYRADSLMPIFSPFIYIFHKVFTYSGIVPLLDFLSGLFNRLTGSFVADKVRVTTGQRHHIKTIISDSREEAILSTEQTNIITRLVDIS